MAIIARYEALSKPGLNACSKLRPDDKGYYRVILGAFNTCNHSGTFYPLLPAVKQLFEEGGIVRRRIDGGFCRGEYGHPDISNMKLPELIARLLKTEEKLLSHHIRRVDLQTWKDEFGKEIVLTIGWLRPCGPYGPTLADHLNNDEENVAFSIRSVTTDTMMKGMYTKIVRDIWTWDFVNEGGIKQANQFQTAGLESIIDSFQFTPEDLEATRKLIIPVAGMESDMSSFTMVKDALGWHKIQVFGLRAIDWK